MKISELPKDIKEKALHYQRTQILNSISKDSMYDSNSDDLIDAFNWKDTKEGVFFWTTWNGTFCETKPSQYNIGIDTFERMEANCNTEEILAFCKGNIDKYNWRKKGSDLEDFKKIIDYANFAIKQLNGKTISPSTDK